MVHVLAIAHQHRRQSYWRDRVPAGLISSTARPNVRSSGQAVCGGSFRSHSICMLDYSST
jgi:hypothetical protein